MYCASTGESEVISSVTLAYMRHVILKFLTSPEVESKQMTRALATILQVPPFIYYVNTFIKVS